MSRFINPIPQYTLSNGDIAAGGTLTFYEGGTDTLLTIYADVNETTTIQNPVTLGSRGEVPNIFFSASARCVLHDANGNQVFDVDPVNSEQAMGAFEVWNSNIVYTQSEIAYGSNGEPYISLVNNNQSNDPVLNAGNNQFWSQVVMPQIWNAQASYDPNELVVENGTVYRSLISDNSGNQPSTDNGTQWKSIANGIYVDYNNTSSGLVAVTAQGALDEIVNLINNLPSSVVYRGQLDVSAGDSALPATPSNGDLYVIAVAGTITVSTAGGAPVATGVEVGEQIIYNGDTGNWDLIAAVTQASTVSYSNTTSGLTATNVQNAIDEVEARVDTAESNITGNVNTLSLHDGRIDSLEAFEASAGSAVTYDVTTSATDTTANRLLKVGDFGLGGQGLPLPNNNFLDVYDSNATYWSNTSSLNPPPIAGNYMVIVSSIAKNTLTGKLSFGSVLALNRDNGNIFHASVNSGVWSWKTVYHSGNAGSAVTYDVTTSSTDTTAGRLTKVGDFGLGKTDNNIYIADCADVTAAVGMYAYTTTALNKPAGSGYGTLFVQKRQNVNGQATFIAQSLDVDEGVYIRIISTVAGRDTGWQELYHTGNTGTAVTYDVTTSATDTTAGRLLKTGDGGLLGRALALPSGNVDNATVGGVIYYGFGGIHVSASTGDNPFPDHNGAFHLECSGEVFTLGSGEYVTQVATVISSIAQRKFRTKPTAANGWSPWTELYHSGNSKNVGTELSDTLNRTLTKLGAISKHFQGSIGNGSLTINNNLYQAGDVIEIHKLHQSGTLTINLINGGSIILPDLTSGTSHTIANGYAVIVQMVCNVTDWRLTIS